MSTAQAVRHTRDAIHVPPVLPVITMTIERNGTMTVAVDGEPLDPPRFGPPWARSSFAEIIDTVLEAGGSPVRVLVYETDGTVFTDLITRPLQRSSTPSAPPPTPHNAADALVDGPDAPAALIDAVPLIAQPGVVRGEEGFLPGEDVAVAIIVRHTKASTDGAARAMLEPGLCRVSAGGEIVLVGRISGTCVIGNLE